MSDNSLSVQNISNLKPEDASIGKPVKKRHPFRTFLIVLVIIIVVVVIGVSATGVYAVPGVSDIFGFGKPKDLGVKTSPEALTSTEKEIPLQITGAQVDYSTASPAEIFSGELAVDTQTSSEEITSWLERHAGSGAPVSDVQVKFIEGGMEISGMVHKYIEAPAYVKVIVNKTGERSVSVDLQKAKVGMFTVPEKYYGDIAQWFEDRVNSRMATIPGLRMDTVEYHDGYSYFVGTYPEVVRPTSAGWTGLIRWE